MAVTQSLRARLEKILPSYPLKRRKKLLSTLMRQKKMSNREVYSKWYYVHNPEKHGVHNTPSSSPESVASTIEAPTPDTVPTYVMRTSSPISSESTATLRAKLGPEIERMPVCYIPIPKTDAGRVAKWLHQTYPDKVFSMSSDPTNDGIVRIYRKA